MAPRRYGAAVADSTTRNLVIGGFLCAALSLIVPPVGIAAMTIGVLLIVRRSVPLGIAILVLGVVLPVPGIAIVQALFVKPYRIPSASMEPTLERADRVLVNKLADPHRGDIVAYTPPAGVEIEECGEQGQPADGHPCSRAIGGEAPFTFIGRIVGEPGDRLSVVDNRVRIDGRPQEEPFVDDETPCADLCDLPKEITVPRGHFYMMGDNRGESSDSRIWGPVPEDDVIGRALFRYWPPDRIEVP
jgi:signal peptidase I